MVTTNIQILVNLIRVSYCLLEMKHGGHRWLGFWTSVLKPIGHKIKANEFEANHVIDDIYLGRFA